MNYFEAHQLLDETLDGQPHSEASVTAALSLTGDIDPDVCRNGLGWGRSSTERRTPRLFTPPIHTIGSTDAGN